MKAAYIPVGATGHVLASLPMVGALAQKGVSIIYFAPERYRALVEGAGAAFSPIPAVAAKDDSVSGDGDFLAGLPLVFLREAEGVIGSILPVLDSFRPDLIIADELALAGRLAAARLNLPLCMIFTSYAPSDRFSICRFWPEYPDTHPARAKARSLAKVFSKAYGVPLLTLREMFEGTGDFNISTLTREFQPEGDSFGENFFFAGAQIAPRAGGAAWTPPQDGKPLVYSSLGSLFNNWPEFYEALFPIVRKMDIHVVCALGRALTPEQLGDIPPNVTLLPFAPQLDILPHADCFITHAGTGSAMEALYFGAPSICLPQMEEQQLTAERMLHVGIACASVHRSAFTGEWLRQSLHTALYDQPFRARAREASQRTRAVSSCRRAADAVVDFMNRWNKKQG